MDHKLFENRASPVFSYPYDRTKEALDKMKESKSFKGIYNNCAPTLRHICCQGTKFE